MGEAGPGRSPKRSQPRFGVAFAAEEICQGRQGTGLSMSLIRKRIPIKNLSVSGTEVELSYGEVWRGDESPLRDFKSKNYLP